MFSVGETLQRARLEQELDVATVAARTKINAKYLKAIEADDRGSLPSSFFYKSFVHQYARTLLLDTTRDRCRDRSRVKRGCSPAIARSRQSNVEKSSSGFVIGVSQIENLCIVGRFDFNAGGLLRHL
jgi:cytoskeletal protein RodZ